jgi:hypothetical protein
MVMTRGAICIAPRHNTICFRLRAIKSGHGGPNLVGRLLDGGVHGQLTRDGIGEPLVDVLQRGRIVLVEDWRIGVLLDRAVERFE